VVKKIRELSCALTAEQIIITITTKERFDFLFISVLVV
jgi:hypothetical protein